MTQSEILTTVGTISLFLICCMLINKRGNTVAPHVDT